MVELIFKPHAQRVFKINIPLQCDVLCILYLTLSHLQAQKVFDQRSALSTLSILLTISHSAHPFSNDFVPKSELNPSFRRNRN